ncbi:helix-turn-helix transcriptional regulator [Halopseudomonas pelagia]|uniref:helix-turn-helix transcriptional regulator n=1 Tax=Halopseudomonas pelagia TaxID=553151 RepID=UPI0003B632C4|nr:AraC family transcriptional regulator [Halopseudomonas pelagia]|tara:strand:- start:25730 stop:26500 length:771 start_codon:yes stop_codon:yes gene_type:complete
MIKTKILDLPVQTSTHAHSQHQLIVGLDGCADFEVMGQGGAVNRLHACLVPGHEAHAFSGRGSNHMLVLDLAEVSESTPGYESDDLSRLFEKPRFLQLDQRLQGLLDFAAHELRDDQSRQLPMAWHLGGVLLHSLHDRLFSMPLVTQPVRSLDLARIDAFILQRLDQPISVADMAAQVYVSPSHFHVLFKQFSGQSPHQYLLRARVAEALRMIRQSRIPLSEVASRCGFSSQSALTHAVRDYSGQTPRKLRLAAGG